MLARLTFRLALGRARTLTMARGFHAYKNPLDLRERGLIKELFPSDRTREFAAHVSHKTPRPPAVYAGFDPTADSLHVGNLLVLVTLLHCQRAGLETVFLVGGATGGVGDPSGKSEERPAVDRATVQDNVKGISADVRRVIENHAALCEGKKLPPAKVLDNYEWYKDVNVLDFLSTTGRHFRVGKMLSRRSVRSRMESSEGISLTEFAYQVSSARNLLFLTSMHCSFSKRKNVSNEV